LQWNFGQGTLQLLFRRLFKEFPQVAAKVLPNGGKALYDALNKGSEKAWALGIQKNSKVLDPWYTALRNLYGTPEWQRIMSDAAVNYKNKAIAMCQKFGLYTDRAFCLFFDIAVQNGSVRNPPAKVTLANIAEAVALQSNSRFQGDVRKRKMAIVNGKNMGRGWDNSITFNDGEAFDISLIVSGKQVTPAIPPFIVNDHTLVPVADIAKALGKKATWNGSTKTVEIK
jgi:hypothetical protein